MTEDSELEQTIADLRAENDDLEQEVARLKEKIESQKEYIFELQEELRATEEEIKETESEHADVIHKLLDETQRQVGTLAIVLPDTPAARRALVALHDSVGRRL